MELLKKYISFWNHVFVLIDDLLKNKNHLSIKRAFYLFAILSFLPFFIACNKDKNEYPLDGPNLSMNDIAGNWKATTANFYHDTLFFDVIAEGGSVSLAIETNGRFIFTIKLPEEADDVSAGQLGFDEEWLAIGYDEYPGEYEYFFIELANGILTLRGQTEFDFEGDGTYEPASVDLILIRD